MLKTEFNPRYLHHHKTKEKPMGDRAMKKWLDPDNPDCTMYIQASWTEGDEPEVGTRTPSMHFEFCDGEKIAYYGHVLIDVAERRAAERALTTIREAVNMLLEQLDSRWL
jgi:hypothetical protein